jgi:hypothetical protein
MLGLYIPSKPICNEKICQGSNKNLSLKDNDPIINYKFRITQRLEL